MFDQSIDDITGNLPGRRDKALLGVSFAAALRRSESAALQVADVRIDAAGMVLTIRRSKTDQEAQGREVGIRRTIHPDTCPVRAVEAWVEAAQIRAGRCFGLGTRRAESPTVYIRIRSVT